MQPGDRDYRYFQDPGLFPEFVEPGNPPPAKPAVPSQANRNVFFGDLHIHTSLSHDAWNFGVTTLPDDAYYFAKGGEIAAAVGTPIQLSRPLDFAAVTDHAEYMGHTRAGTVPLPLDGVDLRELMVRGDMDEIQALWLETSLLQPQEPWEANPVDPQILSDAWALTIASAESNNEPGVFTAFVAYEYSAFPGRSNMLHRNVIFKTAVTPNLPFSEQDSENPEDLWAAMESWESEGVEAIAIPHNMNRSNGWWSRDVKYDGVTPLDAAYAALRSEKEPIAEIFQIKGASEAHPMLSVDDEFADFEIDDVQLNQAGGLSEPSGSYIRDALRRGMELSHSSGFNPYKIGAIGSSDGHQGSPIEEDKYHGTFGMLDGTAGLRTTEIFADAAYPPGVIPMPKWGSGGVAAIWAEENTRASLYDAMVRKETYATSGPRIQLRFFGGYGYTPAILTASDPIGDAYAGGVPMGGDLGPSTGTAPSFIVWAWKDSIGANLDRLQVVKAWVDSNGDSHEKVYNVAASDGRVIDPVDNSVPDIGNTVNPAVPDYTNTIGDPELSVVWTDPDFDHAVEAVYYARALEIPTPRWSTYDAVTLCTTPIDPVSIQERAVTSGIWYAP